MPPSALRTYQPLCVTRRYMCVRAEIQSACRSIATLAERATFFYPGWMYNEPKARQFSFSNTRVMTIVSNWHSVIVVKLGLAGGNLVYGSVPPKSLLGCEASGQRVLHHELSFPRDF